MPRSSTRIVTAGLAVLRVEASANLEPPLRLVDARHRIHGVHQQVQQHLLELHAVADHDREVRWHVGSNRHVAQRGLRRGQGEDVVHDVVELQLRLLGRRALRQGTHALDDGARTLGVGDDVGHDFLQLVHLLAPTREQPSARVGVVGDRGQRLVQLVREGGRHLAERRHARHVRECRLRLPQRLLRLLAIRDVLDERNAVRTAVLGDVDAEPYLDRERGSVLSAMASLVRDDGLARRNTRADPLQVEIRIEVEHVLPDELLARVAEALAGLAVHVQDVSRLVEQEERIARVVDQGAEAHFARTQLVLGALARGDVLAHDEHGDLTVRRSHRSRRLANPEHRAVLADLAQLPAHGLTRMLEAAGDVPTGSLSVGLQEHVQHGTTDQLLDRVAELLGAERVDREHRTGGIEHEVHDRVLFEDGPPALLARPQRFLRSLALRDVVRRHENGDGLTRLVSLERAPDGDLDVRSVARRSSDLALPGGGR